MKDIPKHFVYGYHKNFAGAIKTRPNTPLIFEGVTHFFCGFFGGPKDPIFWLFLGRHNREVSEGLHNSFMSSPRWRLKKSVTRRVVYPNGPFGAPEPCLGPHSLNPIIRGCFAIRLLSHPHNSWGLGTLWVMVLRTSLAPLLRRARLYVLNAILHVLAGPALPARLYILWRPLKHQTSRRTFRNTQKVGVG